MREEIQILKDHDNILEHLLNALPGGSAVYKIGDSIETIYYSEGLLRLTGYNKDEFDRMVREDIIGQVVFEKDRARLYEEVKRADAQGETMNLMFRINSKSGNVIWVELRTTQIDKEENGSVYYATFTKPPEETIQYRDVVDQSLTAVLVLDKENMQVLFVNESLRTMVNIPEEETLIGRNYREFRMKDQQMLDKIKFSELKPGEYQEFHMTSPNGKNLLLRGQERTWCGRDAYIFYIADVTRLVDTQVKERRYVDRLTKLLNRGPANDGIRKCLEKNERGALFLMDIDNFKMVNDTNGHPAGDEVLKSFADAMRHVFDKTAILGRLGGDEFIAYVPEYQSIEQLRDYADNLLIYTEHLVEDPILSEHIGASIGIALAPDNGCDVSTLYTNADKGQYYAKRNGKNRYSFYGKIKELPVARNMGANIETLRRMVQSVQTQKGAFEVQYHAFSNVYQFLERNLTRMQRSTQMVLFSIDRLEQNDERAERNRGELEVAIRYALRTGDLMMNFSQNHIAVLLFNCDGENGRKVAERILIGFKEKDIDCKDNISYEIGSIDNIAK